MKQQHCLKVPYELIKKANERNLFSELTFYYQLKILKNDGLFIREEWSEIQNTYGYAASTLYNKFDRLVKAGFASRIAESTFSLFSYAVIWMDFGYNQEYCIDPIYNKENSFKIFKVSINDFFQYGFLNIVSFHELRFYSNKQNFREMEKMGLTQKNSEVKRLTVKHSSSLDFPAMIADRKVSDLLGFTSSSTGHKLLKRLEEHKLITIELRKDDKGLNKCKIIFINKRTDLPRGK